MQNLIEYSWNYSDTTRSSWFYNKNEFYKISCLILMQILLMMIIVSLSNIRINY